MTALCHLPGETVRNSKKVCRLFAYFPGKEALYVELLLEGYDLLLQRLGQEIRAEADPAAQAAALIDAFLAFSKQYPEYFDIIFFILQRETGGWEGNLPAGQVAKARAKEAQCKQATATILEGVHFGPAQDREALVEAIWGMLAGVIFYFRSDPRFDAIAAQAKALLLGAVFGGQAAGGMAGPVQSGGARPAAPDADTASTPVRTSPAIEC